MTDRSEEVRDVRSEHRVVLPGSCPASRDELQPLLLILEVDARLGVAAAEAPASDERRKVARHAQRDRVHDGVVGNAVNRILHHCWPRAEVDLRDGKAFEARAASVQPIHKQRRLLLEVSQLRPRPWVTEPVAIHLGRRRCDCALHIEDVAPLNLSTLCHHVPPETPQPTGLWCLPLVPVAFGRDDERSVATSAP